MSKLTKPVRRDSILYCAVQGVNKAWVNTKAKMEGFPNTSTYLDAMLDQMRAKEGKPRARKAKSVRKRTKKTAKKR